jgi:hypothetical protein
MPRKTREYCRNLLGRLALSEHHLGESHAQGAVMIDLGEIQVFEGKVPQTGDSFIGRELAPAYLLEELSD